MTRYYYNKTSLLLLSYIIFISTVCGFTSNSLSFVANSYRKTSTSKLNSSGHVLDGQEIRGPITPLGNFVFVRTKDTLTATGGGILLPDEVSQKILKTEQKWHKSFK